MKLLHNFWVSLFGDQQVLNIGKTQLIVNNDWKTFLAFLDSLSSQRLFEKSCNVPTIVPQPSLWQRMHGKVRAFFPRPEERDTWATGKRQRTSHQHRSGSVLFYVWDQSVALASSPVIVKGALTSNERLIMMTKKATTLDRCSTRFSRGRCRSYSTSFAMAFTKEHRPSTG